MRRMLVWALRTAAGVGSLLAQVASGPTTDGPGSMASTPAGVSKPAPVQ